MKNEGRKKWMTAPDRKRQAEDTILRITSNAICGPALHLIMMVTLRAQS